MKILTYLKELQIKELLNINANQQFKAEVHHEGENVHRSQASPLLKTR